MSEHADKPVSQDTDKDAMMEELKAQVKAQALELQKLKREWEEKQDRDVFMAAKSAPIGSRLESPVGQGTARLAIDRATRPPDVDQLNLISVTPWSGNGQK